MTLSPLNTLVLFAYLALMLAIGLRLAGRQTSTEEYFLAGRRMPWLVVAMSMFASLTSAVTYMGLPAAAFKENVAMAVVCVISPVLAPLLLWLFYPFYRRLRVTTSYEYIAARFGRPARFAASGLFILARVGWLGTVIYAPAIALSAVSGLSLTATILIMGAIATGYTYFGGIAADIWTDVVQFVIMVAGAIWVAYTLCATVPDGAAGILAIAREANHLKVLDWHFSLYEMSGAAVAVSFFFQLMQDYGTDQTTVQRLMTTSNARGAALAIGFNAVVDFCMIGLLLFIGLGLFAYYRQPQNLLPPALGGDALLPYYIVHALPDGVSGLLVTAIVAAAMSSMDSGISSLGTVVINDFVKPLRRAPAPDARDLALARYLTLAFGVFGTLVAFYVASLGHLLKAYTTIVSLFNGPILALFLLGVLTRRGHFGGWVIGAACAIPATLWLQYGVKAHWIYFFPFSFGVTISIAYLASLALRYSRCPADLTIWRRRAATAGNEQPTAPRSGEHAQT